MDLNLDGKVALVTGAGGGIGEVIAAALVGEGCVVYFGDSNPDAAARAAVLASDVSAYVAGETIVVDGGFLTRWRCDVESEHGEFGSDRPLPAVHRFPRNSALPEHRAVAPHCSTRLRQEHGVVL